MCVMIVTRCLPKNHYVHIAHIVTYCCIFLWGSCFSKCVCVCFHCFCFWEWKMSCYLLACSFCYLFSLLLQHLGWILRSFSSHNQFVLSIFRSSTSFMSTIAECKVFLIARFHNHFLVSITMSFFLSQMLVFFFFFGFVDQTLHLGCTQCVVIMHDTDIWFQFAPVHWFLSSFCRNNRSKPRGKEEVELPCLAWVLILVMPSPLCFTLHIIFQFPQLHPLLLSMLIT